MLILFATEYFKKWFDLIIFWLISVGAIYSLSMQAAGRVIRRYTSDKSSQYGGSCRIGAGLTNVGDGPCWIQICGPWSLLLFCLTCFASTSWLAVWRRFAVLELGLHSNDGHLGKGLYPEKRFFQNVGSLNLRSPVRSIELALCLRCRWRAASTGGNVAVAHRHHRTL